jgi:tetratricopeptide (TPR) repeat protein
MDAEARFQQLERQHDWEGARAALERAIAETDDATAKASLHLRLGRLLRDQFLQGVAALKHFQDAYKLNPELTESLADARAVYWELGKLGMVQKLLLLELKAAGATERSAHLYNALGDVLSDQGEFEAAKEAYTKALQAGANVADLLADAELGEDAWQERIGELLRTAHSATTSQERAQSFLRAARIARRYAPGEFEEILVRAYAAHPSDPAAAALYETLLVEGERTNTIFERQRELLAEIQDVATRAKVAFTFGARWAQRHHNPEVAAQFLEEALRLDPSQEPAFTFLRERYGQEEGDWERVLRLADELSDRAPRQSAYLLASAGLVAWREQGNILRAQKFFERLGAVAPTHPALDAFEAQTGKPVASRSAVASASHGGARTTDEAQSMDPTPHGNSETEHMDEHEAEQQALDEQAMAVSAERPVASDPPESGEVVGGARVVDAAKVADLKDKLEQAEKRPHEYVKLLVALGDELVDPVERADYYRQAAELYAGKFGNHAEAVKAYELLLDVQSDDAGAIAYLRDMYEKRRDWEKLIGLSRREAEAMEPGPEQTEAFRQMAQLATERIKKPEVCVSLWTRVLESDPTDAEALGALAGLYERSREYEQLATALEQLAEVTFDENQKVEVLTKLGQVAGDRLKDDERAAEAYRMLLTLRPDDRRAQEQLKKRYVSLGRWDDLEMFYAESGNWDEFIRVLESNESRAENDAQRIGMLMKVAELWVTQKGKPDRASRALEKVLSIDETHLEAAERLIPIYEQANNPKGLAKAIEAKLTHIEEPSARLELLRQAAQLYEERLRDKESAFERFKAAFALAPGDEQSQADLERAAKATGDWAQVVAAYQSAIEEADEDTAASLRLRLGRVFVDELGKVDEALAQYRAVYESQPDNGEALTALETLYRKTEGWADLLEVYTKKLALADEPGERKATLFAIAELQEQQLGDAESAIQTYGSVLEEDATDVGALEALDRLYRQTESWENYAGVLERRIELDNAEPVLVDLKYRLAQTQLQQLGDAASALANFQEILFLDANHDGARLALEELLSDTALRGEAARILETIYEQREEWQKLVDALEILAETTSDSEQKVELLRKMASTASNQLGSAEGAIEAQARAVKADPANADARLELEELAEQAGASQRLIQIYRDIALKLTDADLAREYWMRLAAIHERLGAVDPAAEAYNKVLEVDPGNAEALQAMDALYRANERWDALVGVYRKRIDLAEEPGQSEGLYAQMAEVYEEKLGQVDDAIAAYREILALDPTSGLALGALDGLLSRQGKWEELAENLETQLGLADTEEAQGELMLRLAALRESQMGQVAEAIEGYRQVLERDPTNVQALSALERLGRDAAHELLIAEILEPLYRSTGEYQKLIGVHEVQVRRADDASRKVELLHQIAELYEDAAGDAAAAFDTMARALAVDPADATTQDAMDRLARTSDRMADLARVLEQLASEQEEAELGSQLYTSAARVYEGDLGDTDRAVELYRKVLVIDPTNLAAADALQALFQATERFADMSVILQRKAEILEDVDQQKAALYQAATLEEELLNRPERAIAVYEKVLELDPEDVRSVDALISLFLSLSRWEDLLGVYSKKVDLVLDPEEKKQILYEVGAVYERELSNVAHAIDTYQRVLELDPDDLTALGRLDVLYQAAGNWQELLSVLTHEAELTADPAEAVGYQYRIAALYEKHLEDVERAVELYRDILGIQPDHEPTLEALEGIKQGTESPLAAAAVLEQVYDASGDWERLISVLEVQARFADDQYARVDLLQRIAGLYEESLNDPARAFDVYARSISVDSQNEDTLGALERLAMLTERWPAVASLYDQELDKIAEEPERVVELGLRVAQVYEVQLENLEAAITRYRRVLAADPENRTALTSLDRLFTQAERWSELAEVLGKEAEVGESPEEILEFKFRLGQLQEQQLNDVDRAIAAYREVISAAPEHTATLEALEQLFARGVRQVEIGELLEPLYQAAGEWERLLNVREGQLAHLESVEDRVALYHRMAEDAEERLLDADRAFEIQVRAFSENPLNEQTTAELERLAGSIDEGWEKLANAYADVLGSEGLSSATAAAVGNALARVFEEELADVAKAEETYRYVVTAVPAEPQALANLDRIYTSLEQWTDLAGVLEQRAAGAQDEYEKVDLYLRLGSIYEERLTGAAEAAEDAEFVEEAGSADVELSEFEDGEDALEGVQTAAVRPAASSASTAVSHLADAVRAYRVIFDRLQPDNQEAIDALARIYERTEQWSALNGVFQRQLDNAHGDVEESEIRAKMAHLAADRLDNVDGAIEGWKRVLELRGEDPEALKALAHLYEGLGRWAELTDVLERHYDIADSDEDRVHVLSTRARLFDEQLNRADEALEQWQRVLDIDYSNVEALRAIAKIWRRRGSAQELVTALHALVDQGAGQLAAEELVSSYRELGRTYSTVLEQPYEASEAWRHLLEVDATDFEALAELEKIYRAEERWEDVVGVKMQRAAAFSDADERVRELLEVTELWRHPLEAYDNSTAAYDRILEVEPLHERAFKELERLHIRAERWEPLLELYLNRLEHLEEVPVRSELLRRIARVFEERLEDTNQAFDALVNAFSEDYGDDQTSAYLERIAQVTGRWGELINSANAWLTEETEPKKLIQLGLRLGKWYGEDLGRPEYAMPYYQKVLEMDPQNTRVMRQMAAIDRLAGNYQKAGAILNKALEVAVVNEDRKAILVDLGDILYRNLDQPDQATPYYKRALEVDPNYLPALAALERIYEDKGQTQELVDVLTRKVTGIEDAAQGIKERLRLAELLEQNLRDAQGAANIYRQVLEIDSGSLPALRGLERVDQVLQDWPHLVEVLQLQLEVVETERERVEVLLKLAALQEEQFLKADLAAQHLEKALDIAPAEERAYVALERCYRRLKQWHDLISTYERHIQEAADRNTKLELYGHIAQVFRDEIGDIDRAIDALQNIVDADDTNVAALDALSKLHEKQGDAARAIEAMTRVAELTADGKQKVDMYYRIGRAMEERLGDRYGGREKLEMALDLDPTHLPTLAALRTIAVDESDWDAAARYLEQEQTHCEAPRQRAKLLVELGKLRDEMLGEHAQAIAAYEQAIQLDEDCEDAALPLVREYGETGRWAEAAPLAEMLVRKSKNRDRGEQHTLNKLLGKVYASLGEHEKALKAYQTANQLDLTDQESIRGIADAAFGLQDWATALTNYQKVLTSLGDDDVDERTDVYFRLGAIKQGQGQDRQAVNNYEKALALNGEHRPTLDALVDIYAKAKDWKQVAEYKRQILDSVFDGAGRYAILVEIGDLWSEQEKNPHKAMEAYEEALELKPQDHILLHKILQAYQSAEEWQKMVDTLDAIKAIEERPDRQARYLFTQAQIYRDKLEDMDRAVELFNESLDLNPDFLEAFERINKILTAQKNWKQLERSYRKMLHRIAGKGKKELEQTLWHQLGLIYRDRTGQTGEAIEAFRMATAANPDATLERQILAELYESTEQWDEAIKEQRRLLKADPLAIDNYQALYRLYLHKQAYDEAWCLAAAMSFMRKADEQTERFYNDFKPAGMLQVTGRLTNEHWMRALVHPNENLYISKIFEMIAGPALMAKVAQLKAQGKLQLPDPRFKQDPATSTVTFAKTFGWAAQVLGIAAPDLYVRNDVPAYVTSVVAERPAMIAGQLVLSGFQPQELTFICGKHLTVFRPEHFIRTLFPTQAELTIMLFAGVMLAAPQQPMPPDMAPQIRATAQGLAPYMQPVQLEGLRQVVKKFIEAGAKANIKRWNQAVELTSCRAGLVLCADLEIAKKIISQEQQLPGDLPVADKLKELLLFAVSEEYSAIRKALGVAVNA